jgi:hypothetical protein
MKGTGAVKTAIIIPSIRPQAGAAVELILHDAVSAGVGLSNISVYFSIDYPLTSVSKAIQLRNEHRSAVRHVKYIDSNRRSALARRFSRSYASGKLLEHTLIGRGYASARNAALIEALSDGNDFAISVDDDVLPILPLRTSNNEIEWIAANLVRTHLQYLQAGADVTRGNYLGYESPIVDLSGVISDECQLALSRALSLGNEVLSSDCLSNSPTVSMLDTIGNNATQFTHKAPRTGMIIYGGNVGISLTALAEGRIPAFYCPRGARGEDTFFGYFLPGEAHVVTVPAAVFHDPFHLYPCLLQRRYPTTLIPSVKPTQENLQRFAKAFRGWVKYAPLWVRSQHDDSREGREILAEISNIYRSHACCLLPLGLGEVPQLLMSSINSARSEFQLLYEVDRIWRTRMIPHLRDRIAPQDY